MNERAGRGSIWRPSSLLLVALATGILTGLAEAAFLEAQRLALGRIVFMGRHSWWMKPLAEASLFFLVVGITLLGSRLVGRRPSVRAMASLTAALGALSMLVMVPQIHPLARLVLGIAIGVQAGRLFARWLGGREALARRAATVVTAGMGLAAAVLIGVGSRDRGRPGPEPIEGTPNVLLLVLDTVRARSLSAYGYEKPTTPVLERLASEGILFERAIASAPWTLPSHASMFTGLDAHRLSANWRMPLDDRPPTLAEHLLASGYRTAGFVANMGYAGWETGLSRGFQHYEDHPISVRQILVESALFRWGLGTDLARSVAGRDENFVRKRADDVNEAFLRWLGRDEGRPYFAFLNYYDAHGPYQPSEPFRSAFAEGEPRGPRSPLHRWLENPFEEPPTDAELERERWAYEASIAFIDDQIGRLLEELERRGALENTIVVVTSDHGEEFGEHGTYDHGNSLYLDGLHVPLILRFPAVLPAGTRVDDVVPLKALAPTIAGLTGTGPGPFEGVSLLRGSREPGGRAWEPVLSHVSFAPRLPDWFPVSKGDMYALTDAEWHYIRNGDGVVELYRLPEDPMELRDVAGSAAGRPVADSLAALLERRLR